MQYTIQKGDTLSRLAKRFGTSVSALANQNGVTDVNKIYAGHTLEIPSAAPQAAITPLAPETPQWGAPSGGTLLPASTAAAPKAPDIKPYTSAYTERIEAILDGLENRPDFTYDYSDDPLYQNYKDSYTQGGRLAMLDTMGDAAALTGGYGSSYGQSVGQQAYQGYMTALAGEVPTLAAQAYDKYRREGEDMLSSLSSYQSLDAADYNRYRDEAEDAYKQYSLAYQQYDDARTDELKRYTAALEDRRWQQEQAYKQAQDALKQQNKETELALKGAKSNASAARSGAASGKPAASGEGDKIYALFSSMTNRESAAMLSDAPSVAYIKSVLGESGYAELARLYGAKN